MSDEFGLLPTGFAAKPESAIKDSLDGGARTALGPSLPLGPKTLFGEYNGIIAAAIAEVWELAQAVDASGDPDGATGTSLEQVCALTGTKRDPATASTVVETLTGTADTLVTAGSRVGSATTTAQFATAFDAVLVALTAWASGTVYAVGDRVTNASRAYVCITAGTSAGSGGPTTTAADITDNSAHWRYMGEGVAAGDVATACTVTGPTVATSGDLTTIITPVGGWSSAINLLDADPGRADETDADLRVKREEELAANDAPVPDAIREALLKPVAQGGAGATSATVFYNDTDLTDGDGIPPHSVECLVRGGVTQDVIDVIFAHTALGIGTHGTTSGSATDSEGVTHTVSFTRPAEITIYVDITLKYDAALYPTDGDTEVKAAIVAFGDLSSTGKNAVAVAIGAQAFKVDGVFDVPAAAGIGGTLIKTTAGPTSDVTIAIAKRELAVFDSSRITVHSSAGTP
jgi:uncharacterized phage protein gp47/JayE